MSFEPAQQSTVAQVAEDRRVFNQAVPADLEALRRACGQPPDAKPLPRYYAGEEISTAPEWQGLRVEVIGFKLTPDVSTVPVFYPWVYDEFPQISGPFIVGRWCHRYPSRNGFLEVSWDGRQRPSMRLRRSVHFLGAGTADDAAQLLTLWTTDADETKVHLSAEPSEPQIPKPRQRARRDRDLDLAQAIHVAIGLMKGGHQPTEEEVQHAVADLECVSIHGVASRWDRANPKITIGEIKTLAKERAPLMHLVRDQETT